jgi:type I restriction enzyme M protein
MESNKQLLEAWQNGVQLGHAWWAFADADNKKRFRELQREGTGSHLGLQRSLEIDLVARVSAGELQAIGIEGGSDPRPVSIPQYYFSKRAEIDWDEETIAAFGKKFHEVRVEDEDRMQAALRAVEKKQLPHMLCVTNMLLHSVRDPSFVRHNNTLARPYADYGPSDRVDIVLTNPPFGGHEEAGIESNFPTNFRTRETADLFLALIVRLLRPGGRAAVVLPDGILFGEGVKTRLKEHLMEECNLHTIVRLPNSVFRPYASIGTNLLFFEKTGPTKETWFWEHRVPEGQKGYSMTKPIRFEDLQGCIDWWGGAKRKGRKETPLAWVMTADDVKARGYNLAIKNPNTMADDPGDPETLLSDLAAAEVETASLRNQLKAILAEALAR